MIDELIEVKSYLNGEGINKKNLYRICFLLAKWFKEQGLSHASIRNSIFEWASTHGIYIKYNLNNIIYKALDDKSRLKDNIVVRINNKDIEEIKSRFDSKNTKLVALAILCYAKAYADRDRCFSVSSVALASWLHMHPSNLSSRCLKELVDFEYISKIAQPKNNFKWNSETTNTKYKINVGLYNGGDFVLSDNDIIGLFNSIFS